MKFSIRNPKIGRSAVVAIAVAAVLSIGFPALLANGVPGSTNSSTEGSSLEQNETMPNFFQGQVFQSEYEQGFFVGSPSPSPIPSGQGPTLLGVAPTVFPGLSGDTNPFFVLVPAWGCAGAGGGVSCGLLNALAPAYNATFALSGMETCLPATIQTCWDHPSTIGIPNALLGGGSGFTMEPLPGHDHLIASLENFQDVWWNITVVLVFNQAAWPNPAGTHGITSVTNLTAGPVSSGGFVTESLVQAVLDGDVLNPAVLGLSGLGVVTNTFLNFANLPPGAT
jgi:hypothetical protein